MDHMLSFTDNLGRCSDEISVIKDSDSGREMIYQT